MTHVVYIVKPVHLIILRMVHVRIIAKQLCMREMRAFFLFN